MKRLLGFAFALLGWSSLVCCVALAPNSLLADPGPNPSDFCVPANCDIGPQKCVNDTIDPCEDSSDMCYAGPPTKCPRPKCKCMEIGSSGVCECKDTTAPPAP